MTLLQTVEVAKHRNAKLMAALCLLGVAVGCRSSQPPSDVEPVVASVVNQVLKETPVVGMSVAIARGGAIVFAKGFGVADLDSRQGLDADAVLDIGSIGKQFTAAAILELAAEGRVDLDAAVGQYLHDWNDRARGITVRQLLNHTSGLEDPPFSEENPERRFLSPASAGDLLNQTRSAAFRFAPQETWFYANTGYQLLGLIVERLHRKPYGQVIDEVIARPLSLRTLIYCDTRRHVGKRVSDYVVRDGKPEPIPPVDVSWFGGAGSLCASASDLVRWEQALSTGGVIAADMRNVMHSRAQIRAGDASLEVEYGAGRAFGMYGGHRKIGHTGSGAGITAMLANYPDDEVIIAVLVNTNGGGVPDARAIEARIAAQLFAFPEPKEADDVPVTAKQATAWTGTYVGSFGPLEMHVSACEGAGMCVSLFGRNRPRRLRHRGDGVFAGPLGPGSELRFAPETGQAQWIVHTMYGLHDNVFRRTATTAALNR